MKNIGAYFWPELNLIQLYKFVCAIPTQNINVGSKQPISRLSRQTRVKGVRIFYSYITMYIIIIVLS